MTAPQRPAANSDARKRAEERARLMQRVEDSRLALNATPWWRPLKRQEAAATYKTALLMGALWEVRNRPEATS